MTLTVGSLFSGIGGLDLGLEQAGMRTAWQVEYDDWARAKLDENFPHTEKFKDVREVGKHNLKSVDLICGGFPCQDISTLNDTRGGIEGERSGLWSEYRRIICELRPRYALIENVTALILDGLERVLCDLAAVGYDAEWQTLRASSFGLPQRRRRLFIISYPMCQRFPAAPFFSKDDLQDMYAADPVWNVTTIRLNDLEFTYPSIPEHLRVDHGLSFELSEIEAAIRGYGNAVAPPVAKWIGERIISFDEKWRMNCQIP
jgi:DNA (cytosine-5)-methyltransferase 1